MGKLLDPTTRDRLRAVAGRPPLGLSFIDNVRENAPLYQGGVNTASVTAGASGKFLGPLIPAEPGYTCSNVLMVGGNTAATLGSNSDSHWWMVVLDTLGNVLAASADQGTTAIPNNNPVTAALSAPAVVPDDQYGLYAGIVLNFGTGGVPAMPTWRGQSGFSAKCCDGTIPGTPIPVIENGAVTTTLPASFALLNSSRSAIPYARVW